MSEPLKDRVNKLEFKVDENTKDIGKLEGNQNKVAWFIILFVLGALLTLVIKGN